MGKHVPRVAGLLLPTLALLLASTLALPVVTGSGDPPEKRVLDERNAPRHPVAVEIEALMETQRIRLRALQGEVASVSDPTAELALQREIQRIKVETEIAMYEVQIRHAESRGDLSTADNLRKVLTTYENLGRRRTGKELDLPESDRPGQEVAP